MCDFKRTMGYIGIDVEHDSETFIIEKYKKFDILGKAHDSIFHFIGSTLQWKDLASLKLLGKRFNNLVTYESIVDRMLVDKTPLDVLSICVFSNNVPYLEGLLNTRRNDIPINMLTECLVYAIQTKRNDIAKALSAIVSLPKTCRADKEFHQTRVEDVMIMNQSFATLQPLDWTSLSSYLTGAQSEHSAELSHRKLIQISAMSDNVDMFKFFLDKYKIAIIHNDIRVAIYYASHNVINEMSRIQGKDFMLSEKMLIDYLWYYRTRYCTFEDTLKFLKFTLERRFILSQKVIKTMLAIIHYGGADYGETGEFIKILEVYGTNKQLDKVMKFFIYHKYTWHVSQMIDISKRLVYTQKHLNLIEINSKFWNAYHDTDVEYVFINKLKLQERKNYLVNL